MSISGQCILIESSKFPVLEGEEDELVNEGMYGKALCLYLQNELPKKNINVPSLCCEDWGWWIEVQSGDFEIGLCIYADPESGKSPTRYAIMSSITQGKKWVWSKFRSIDVSKDVIKIMDSVETVFKQDDEITKVTRHDDFALY
ncbi:MAG: hypothetical protein AAF446_00180 [Pseudomonadota bacterium]